MSCRDVISHMKFGYFTSISHQLLGLLFLFNGHYGLCSWERSIWNIELTTIFHLHTQD
jgi:hypothetical protein